MENSVKAVLFDYGGTIDNFGDHWAVTLREAHNAAGLGDVPLEDFIEAYIAGERAMAKGGCVTPQSDYCHTMLVKARLELEALRNKGYDMTDALLEERAQAVADYCDAAARRSVEAAKPVLEHLSKKYKLVLVSNFYGNVAAVIDAYGLTPYFTDIIDSTAVGVKKPDPEIFAMAIRRLGLAPADAAVVGDSIDKDIEPALSLGCRAYWIVGRQWFRADPSPAPCPAIRTLDQLPL